MYPKKRTTITTCLLALALVAIGFSPPVQAQTDSGVQNAKEPEKDIWARDKLTGNWYGLRTDLTEHGVNIDLRLTQFYQAVVDGGVKTGDEYGGVMDYILNVDGHKLGLWQGSFLNVHATTQFGENIIGDAGPFGLPNAAMMYPLPDYRPTEITGMYGMQMLSQNFGLMAGKINSVDLWTMIYPHTGGGIEGFINVNMVAAAMPWFRWVNLSEMGAGALVLTDDGQIRGGVLAVDTQNVTTKSGFEDMFKNGVGVLGLWRFFFEMDDKPGSILFAFGGSTGSYDSLEPSDWDFVPGVGLVGAEKSGAWSGAIYYDQILYQDPGNDKQNLRLYTGWSISDGNPSFGKFGGLVSLEATGLLFGREKDRAGIGVFYNELSSDFKDLVDIAGVDLTDTWGVETYYNYEVTPWFHLTGDVQIVQGANEAKDPATILGVRAVLDF